MSIRGRMWLSYFGWEERSRQVELPSPGACELTKVMLRQTTAQGIRIEGVLRLVNRDFISLAYSLPRMRACELKSYKRGRRLAYVASLSYPTRMRMLHATSVGVK